MAQKRYVPPALRGVEGADGGAPIPASPKLYPTMPVDVSDAIKAFPRLHPTAAARERRFRQDIVQLAWDIARDPGPMLAAARADRALSPHGQLLPLPYFGQAMVEMLNTATGGVRIESRREVAGLLRSSVLMLRQGDVDGASLALGPIAQLLGGRPVPEALAEVVRRTYPSAPAGYAPEPRAVEEARRALARRPPAKG